MTSDTLKTLKDHLDPEIKNKRILALDGGGVKGILTIAHLEKIESILKEKYGNNDSFRLCDHFDLIAGTSTGAIIASCLALGWKVADIKDKYFSLSHEVFDGSLVRWGFIRAKYNRKKLKSELQKVFGKKTKLNSEDIKTGLLIITKRADTGSPWPISNNPKGNYYKSRPNGTIGNGDYPLWKVIRASTAAPHFFDPEKMTISNKSKYNAVNGTFVDGGVSPYNNPALQALMYSTFKGYNINWSITKNQIEIVSLGTGYKKDSSSLSKSAVGDAFKSLVSLMDNTANLQEIILQWISNSPTARNFDREINDLNGDLLTEKPLIKYLRYDVNFQQDEIIKLNAKYKYDKRIKKLSEMDSPKNMDLLYEIGEISANLNINKNHI